MTQEEKKTLSNAILGYLPYKLKVRYYDMEDGREEDGYIEGVSCYKNEITFDVDQYSIKAEGLKPYLRPMSSMTEEEAEELDEMNIYNKPISFYNRHGEEPHFYTECNVINAIEATQYIDWLNKNMFDYRGLIPMGLALPAKEGMYNLN